MQKGEKHKDFPEQEQVKQPGDEYKMNPQPEFWDENYRASGKLENKVALITGGDSGIGRSVAVHFAAEGADVAILFLNESQDALDTAAFIREYFTKEPLLIKCDIRDEASCKRAVEEVEARFRKVNVLVNNAAVQFPKESIEEIDELQLLDTFRTNIFSMFYLTKAVIKKMEEGDTIINTTSVTAYRGSHHLIDYSSTKGAIVPFTRSLASNLADRKIRVNGVAPGPVWTPLIPSSFDKKEVAEFGSDVPLHRAGEPKEIAPAYVFLASNDSSYFTGQILHPNGGEIING